MRLKDEHVCIQIGFQHSSTSVNLKHPCPMYAALTMFVAIAIPFFGGLMGFFGGLALAPTTYFVSEVTSNFFHAIVIC